MVDSIEQGPEVCVSEFERVTAQPWQVGFQTPMSTSMEAITNFHDDLMFYVIFITIFVLYMLVKTATMFYWSETNPNVSYWLEHAKFFMKLNHHTGLEVA